MNCDWTKENVVLYIYGELADDAKFEYEQHVRHCLGCRRELEQALEFKDAMAAAPVKDVSPNFLAANRMQLQEALEHAEQSRNIFSSFIFDATGWFHQIKLAPAHDRRAADAWLCGRRGHNLQDDGRQEGPDHQQVAMAARLMFRLLKRTLAQSNRLRPRQIPTRSRSSTTRCSRRY